MHFNSKLIEKLIQHIKKNQWQYILLSSVFILGIIAGNYKVVGLEGGVQKYLQELIERYLLQKNLEELKWQVLWGQSFINQAKIIIGIWFLGLTIIGAPIILGLIFYKGFSLGFTVGFLIHAKQGMGFLISLISILPQNLIYVPCTVIWAVVAVNFSLFLIKRGRKNLGDSLVSALLYYTILMIIFLLVLGIGSFMEATLGPWLLGFCI